MSSLTGLTDYQLRLIAALAEKNRFGFVTGAELATLTKRPVAGTHQTAASLVRHKALVKGNLPDGTAGRPHVAYKLTPHAVALLNREQAVHGRGRVGATLETITAYRAAIIKLTEGISGIAVDETCRNCGFPEMSGRVRWPEGVPLGVLTCRGCGHAEVNE